MIAWFIDFKIMYLARRKGAGSMAIRGRPIPRSQNNILKLIDQQKANMT
jgi:hypothetical protein